MCSKFLAYMFLFLSRELLSTVSIIQILVICSVNFKVLFLFWLYNFNHFHVDSLLFFF
jgi:hypothetical protein